MHLPFVLLAFQAWWKVIASRVLGSSVPNQAVFLVNGIFPITTPDHINYQSGVMMAEAMKYAIGKINKNTTYLNGYTLSIDTIFDSVNEASVQKDILTTFIMKIPFLIGPFSSETTYIGSILTATFKQIAVSYSATYSDFDKTQHYMVRTVPSDKYRMKAALDIVRKLKWNYIGIISSSGYNGEREALRFVSKLLDLGICLANQVDLQSQETQTGYTKAIKTMNDDHRLKALIFFTTNRDSRSLLLALQRYRLKNRFFILCIYGCTSYIEVVRGVEKIADGIISMDIQKKEDLDFKKYFLSLRPTNYIHHPKSSNYFLPFWEDVFNCSLKQINGNGRKLCNGSEKLSVGKGYYPLTPVSSVMHAVYVIAEVIKIALNNICDELKKQNKTRCVAESDIDRLNKYFYQSFTPKYNDGTMLPDSEDETVVTYEIHHYQNNKNSLVGKWAIKRDLANQKRTESRGESEVAKFNLHPIWNYLENGSIIPTDASCSQVCPAGHIKIRDTNILKEKCCWTCNPCPHNSIAYNDTCIRCKETEKADHDAANCTQLPRKFIELNRIESWVFFTFSVLGLLLVFFVATIFLRYNGNRIVRSSGRDLCYLILLGICLTFLCPFLFLTKPSTETCLFRGGLPGIAFICCYAPLFLRTNRIYRIFFHAKISVSRPSLVSSQSQLIVSCGIVAIQVLLVVVWFVSKIPSPQETVAPNKEYVNLHCRADTSPILLLLNLALSVIFMVSCTVLAFKTRHFPKNYNEAKYIGVTLYLSCVAWAVFFPGYFLTNPKTEFLREYLMCAICVAIGYITLFGLFGQKVALLLWCGVEANDAGKPTWYLSDSESNERQHPQLDTLVRYSESKDKDPPQQTDMLNVRTPTQETLL